MMNPRSKVSNASIHTTNLTRKKREKTHTHSHKKHPKIKKATSKTEREHAHHAPFNDEVRGTARHQHISPDAVPEVLAVGRA